MLEEVFKNYDLIYRNILKNFYPSLGSTGFQERNLTVNFSKAFEKTYNDIITWFEFQFGDNKNKHFDAIIIHNDNIYFIEAKRYSSPNRKKESIYADINRINDYVINNFNQDERFKNYNIKNFYGVILADVWKETLGKKSIHKQYVDKLFFKELNLNNYEYNVIDFDDIEDCKNYSLLSFVWNIK